VANAGTMPSCWKRWKWPPAEATRPRAFISVLGADECTPKTRRPDQSCEGVLAAADSGPKAPRLHMALATTTVSGCLKPMLQRPNFSPADKNRLSHQRQEHGFSYERAWGLA